MSINRTDIIKGLITKEIGEVEEPLEITMNFLEKELYNQIKDQIDTITKAVGLPSVDSVTRRQSYEVALNEYLSLHPIDIEPCSSLVKKGYKTWLTEARKKVIGWDYSKRYFRYLADKGRADSVLKENQEACQNILGKLGDPTLPSFFSKGLVVGSVQSGKTENFNGVINNAVDSGYRLVIVLSGIMEDLRSQTQKRIESDVIGTGIIDESLDTKGAKGVGLTTKFGLAKGGQIEQAISITSYKTDFNRNLVEADFSLDNLNILVCKKNVGILQNLLIWLHDYLEENQDALNIPLLIVDDEADNASLNNLGAKGREYATKTNGHIRAILALFHRKSYLGYTATPFANVLQDRNKTPKSSWLINYNRNGQATKKEFSQENNIFPDDFIILLKPPTNYVGAKEIFETMEPINNESGEKLPLVVPVKDSVDFFPSRVIQHSDGTISGIESVSNKAEFERSPLFTEFVSYEEYRQSTRASKRDDNFPTALPNSLKESVACFILTIAVREARKPRMIYSRGYNPHHTMLIHTSRFIPWQNRTKDLIHSYIAELSSGLLNDIQTEPDSVYQYFKTIWYKYYAEIVESISSYLPKGYVDPYMTPLTFDSITPRLESAATDIAVKALNSFTKDKVQYNNANPQKVIAIGGNRLSRGFTLEGLTVNYFVRSAGCADTLLQMGRWFGYRPGYLDCCKIFTTTDLINRFNSTTITVEELEGEFRKMEADSRSPNDFTLRVRKHPGALKITRPSILKNTTEVKWSYQDHLVQATSFSINRDDIKSAWNSFKNNVIKPYKFYQKNDFWVTKTNGEGGMDIVRNIADLDEDKKMGLVRFIKLANRKNKITNWMIAVKTTGTGRYLPSHESKLPFNIKNLAVRRGPKDGSRYRDDFISELKTFSATGRNKNIVSSGKDLSLFLTDDEINEAENEFRLERKIYYARKNPNWSSTQAKEKADSITIPEKIYREKMSDKNALIVIYLLDSKSVFLQEEGQEDEELAEIVITDGIDLDIPLVGYAIGIPPINPDPGGTYVKGDYDIADDDDEEEEVCDEDDSIPSDYKE